MNERPQFFEVELERMMNQAEVDAKERRFVRLAWIICILGSLSAWALIWKAFAG